jgi:Glycosyl transferase family group 2
MVKRLFEILPGALAWATIVLMFVLSRYLPVWVSIFIILFDIYWLLKTVYLSLHLRATFVEMRKNLKIDWGARLRELGAGGSRGSRGSRGGPSPDEIYHLVILPTYREPYEVMKESFARLAAATCPKEKTLVVLALEARGGEAARAVGERIEKEYSGVFLRLLTTVHPSGLAGEIPGKGSNETWAALRAKESLIDPLKLNYDNIIVSVFDADTQVPPEYFNRLAYVFLSAENRLRAIYQPVPLFTNNIREAPALARVVAFSTTFWQMMQQSRPERLTSFSSQSIPFRMLLDIGFWHKDIVSEDSRIFWQGFLRYRGDFRVEPLFFPVSMDANVAPKFWQSMKNLYKQQRRWAWGCENIPYMLTGFRRDPAIPSRKKWYWTFNTLEGFHSWATNALMIFALGWLPIFLGGQHFNYTLLSYNLPRITRYIITLSMVGIASSAVLAILLLPKRPSRSRVLNYLLYFFEWLLMPITLIVFGAFPGLEAQTRLMLGGRARLGFWATPKGRYAKQAQPAVIK